MVTKTTNTYDSSLVKGSTYDYATKGLIVEFPTALYSYRDVSLDDYTKFVNATSQGKALNQYIKKYEYTKIESENVID